MNLAKTDILVELHVPNFKEAKKFYGKLGFKVVWERKPEEEKGYLVLKRGNSILCFWSGNKNVWNHIYFKHFPKTTKRGYGVEIVIMVKNVEEFYTKVKKFAKVVEKLKMQPWGSKDFRIEDPFGFYLRFTEPYNTLDDANAVP